MSIFDEPKRDRFIGLLQTTNRPGIDNLLGWLETTDFYTAPASTKYHGAIEGGLLAHSLAVYDNLLEIANIFMPDKPDETLVIVALLHDICKANFYKTEMRWRKDDNNKWEQYATYGIEDQFPAGHGEKSVIIAQTFIRLTPEEVMAIRWHMGGYDDGGYASRQAMSAAMEQYPLVAAVHMADLATSFFDKK